MRLTLQEHTCLQPPLLLTPDAAQVQKYLQLWKQLQVPELLGELAASLAASAQPKKGAAGMRSGAQGLLAVQRLVSGTAGCCAAASRACTGCGLKGRAVEQAARLQRRCSRHCTGRRQRCARSLR